MSHTTHDSDGTTDVSVTDFVNERDCRALTETMFVAQDAPDLYTVRTESGEYVVDVREPACTCPDFQYRDVKCKHIRRVELESDPGATTALAESLDDALSRLDDRLAYLASKRAECVQLQAAIERFEHR